MPLERGRWAGLHNIYYVTPPDDKGGGEEGAPPLLVHKAPTAPLTNIYIIIIIIYNI